MKKKILFSAIIALFVILLAPNVYAESSLPYTYKSNTITFNSNYEQWDILYVEYDYAILEFDAPEGTRGTISFYASNDWPSEKNLLGKTVDNVKLKAHNKVYILPKINNFGLPTDQTLFFGLGSSQDIITTITDPNVYFGYAVRIDGIPSTNVSLTYYKI